MNTTSVLRSLLWVVLIVLGLGVFAQYSRHLGWTKTMDYSKLVRHIEKGEVESLTITSDTARVELKKGAPGSQWRYTTVLPEPPADQEFYKLARENVRSVKIVRSFWRSGWATLLVSVLLPMLLICVLFMFIARQNALSYKQAMSAGQHPFVVPPSGGVEAKGELKGQDKILLAGLVFHGYHGCHPAEAELGQKFVVDIELSCDLSAAGRTDDLTQTVDYRKIYTEVKNIVEGKRYKLIETVAEDIASTVLKGYAVSQVRVRVQKPQVALGGALEYVGVEVVRPTP